MVKNKEFRKELLEVLNNFREDHKIKEYVADYIFGKYPSKEATSVAWLVFEVCNSFSDNEIGRFDYLSEIVADIEDLVENIKDLEEKYK